MDNQVKNRQIYNREIVKKISEMVEKYPDLRFTQILLNMEILDKKRDLFYEESLTTLMRVKDI
jgi:hypothetical protein